MRACVVGSTNVDLVVDLVHLPLPGETALAADRRREAGGKGANQAAALAKLGAEVTLVSAVGDDEDGVWSVEQLVEAGVLVAQVDVVPAPTGLAVVMLESSGENAIVVVPGANSLVTAPTSLQGYEVLLLSLEVPLAVVEQAAAAARAAGVPVVLNAAPAQPLGFLGSVDVVVLNEGELASLGGDPSALATLVVVTLGPQGCLVVEPAGSTRVRAPAVHAVDTTGAGDCFAAAIAYGTGNGWPLVRAAELACAAASLSVMAPGARGGHPTLDAALRAQPRP